MIQHSPPLPLNVSRFNQCVYMLFSSQQIHAWRKFVHTVSVNMKIPVAVADLTFRKTFLEKCFCIVTPLLHSLYALSCLTKIFFFVLLEFRASLRAGTLAACFQSVNLQISHSQKPSDFKDQEQG